MRPAMDTRPSSVTARASKWSRLALALLFVATVGAGYDGFTAIVESAVRRFRPIALTAAAAVLALIPLTRESFWAPMALAHDGWRHRGHRPDADLPACPLRARISRESAGGWESAFRG